MLSDFVNLSVTPCSIRHHLSINLPWKHAHRVPTVKVVCLISRFVLHRNKHMYYYLLAKSQLMSDAQCSAAPDATSAVKHNVVVSFCGSLHFKPLLKELRGQLQRLLQVVHWRAYQQRTHMLTTNAGKQTSPYKFQNPAYVGRWRPGEFVQPGTHQDFSHQRAECYGLPAWSSALSRSPLNLKSNKESKQEERVLIYCCL